MSAFLEITDTQELVKFCKSLETNAEPFIALDTEFIRERTYWPHLCLIQVACQGQQALIDPLSKGMDLTPFFQVLKNPTILKIFHAGRQDLEIFYELTQELPHPIFDTQVAAMVCGFGDSVGYSTLVQGLLKHTLDKSIRFSDWAHRPLTADQKQYALDDVRYLYTLYPLLDQKIQLSHRLSWIQEEMQKLTDPTIYSVNPQEMWRRLKIAQKTPRYLARLQALAALRETIAQHHNLPRTWILKDEGLQDLALRPPKDLKSLSNRRFIVSKFFRGADLLQALEKAEAMPLAQCPSFPKEPRLSSKAPFVLDVLKLLLRMQSETHHVAGRLIATASDLEVLVRSLDQANIPALKGWRREIFGERALKFLKGQLFLSLDPSGSVCFSESSGLSLAPQHSPPPYERD